MSVHVLATRLASPSTSRKPDAERWGPSSGLLRAEALRSFAGVLARLSGCGDRIGDEEARSGPLQLLARLNRSKTATQRVSESSGRRATTKLLRLTVTTVIIAAAVAPSSDSWGAGLPPVPRRTRAASDSASATIWPIRVVVV